ncbi:MAG: hypothetical protein IJZ08_08585 [Clostridia bacterium]|nr:hypothetical protein [Clostridia bacterium]
MLTESEIQELLEQKKSLQGKINAKEKEKKALYEANKEKLDERSAHQKKAGLFQTLGILCAIVGVIALLFVGNTVLKILLAVIGIGGFVGLFILRAGPLAQVKVLSVDLADCDQAEAQINDDIGEAEKEISNINESLEAYEMEKKYEQYTRGHICVYLGWSFDAKSKTPKESANYYMDPLETKVYIDGIEYGSTEKPFAAFEVTPGPHVVKISAVMLFGGANGTPYRVESKAHQVKVTDKSVFMFYHWSFCPGKGFCHHDLFLKSYDNVHSFLSATHNLH